ncbi:DUF4153 domain-containing protein [Epilithonimonas zeae]|uniref:DUF4153 domain-containing protein n=1 Tax=Epilithonimonas zeae TaxID=1416779 RepID=A0A1N6F4I4_9FLAO|nr:DUF4153 domain-containing protein [Epilithonimonas zeae]SIN90171.1 protein of unknown function [Epilithonimonas zeae]
MIQKLNEIFGKALYAIRQYPLVLLMALSASICLMFIAEDNFRTSEKVFTLTKFTLVSCLGISLMFGLKILSQRIGKQFLLELGGILFIVLLYFLLPKLEKDFTEVYAFLLVPTYILSHLFVSFAAFFRKKTEMDFWQYNKNLFINIFLTTIFTGVLTGGVELAIVAVDQLFDFNFSDKIYLRVFYLLAIFGSSLIFLLFNEKGLEYLEKEGAYPVVLKFFTQYILIPLLIIYVVILYFYSGKILLNWELPRGWVSYLVLAYSIVGILAILLVHPLKENSAKSWVKMFSKIFYFTLIPLLILLLTAIFTRILEYGYTEPRYYVLLLAIWLVTVMFYFILNKNQNIKFIPISLFAFGLFSLIFPYFNTFSVAKRSQENQLMKVLNDHKLLTSNQKINFKKSVADSVVTKIGNEFVFLIKRNDKDFLLNLIDTKKSKDLAKNINENNFWSANSDLYYSFSDIKKTDKYASDYDRLEVISDQNIIDVKDYQYVFYFNRYNHGNKKIGNDNFEIYDRVTDENPQFKVILNSDEEADFSSLIKDLVKKYKGKVGKVNVPEISMEADLGDYHLKMILGSFSTEQYRSNTYPNISYDDAYLLIRKK